MKITKRELLTVFFLSNIFSITALANTATTTFQVNAKVISFCLVGDGGSALYQTKMLNQMTFDPRKENSKAVVVTCGLNTPYTVITQEQAAINKAVQPEKTDNALAVHSPLYAINTKNLLSANNFQNYPSFSDVCSVPILPTVKKPKPAVVATSTINVTVNF